ncbi:unnamed protein product [Vitrella brassicaformis CCMP3155]|uniref:Glucose-methanol-choline oxidoreductase N-terminal domain-containing protein n=1 Tax=Vitrella brassicaformis (strain CCMP3155) TaxID=1169540 RepID=A0A0G4ECV7_VITBC|nr:unnamed protein product [Vitrella brassicaformis CCMP3155]|eukprot:CEL93819.1 unnamed protein product [Vitrella brassicaformis CCMP3155]
MVLLIIMWGDIGCAPPAAEQEVGKLAHRAASATPSGSKDAAHFDYIVVGGGAAGIPLAFTLAEGGKTDVLLIERGGRREDHPDTLTPAGWGVALRKPDVAQHIRTLDNVATHVSNVLSGGTALNAGIQIKELADYYQYLERFGASFDMQLVNESYSWIFDQTSQPMGWNEPWTSAVQHAQETVGFTPHHDACEHLTYGTFTTFSLFEDGLSPYRKRLAADVLLNGTLADPPGVPSGLEVMLRKTVTRILFDTSGELPRATCVEFVDSPEVLEPIDSFANAGLSKKGGNPSGASKRQDGDVGRACIRPGGEVFLSAGAIFTPHLLMNSGVGPKEVVSRVMANKGGEVVKDIPELGQNLHERIWTAVMVFLDHDIPADGHNATLGTTSGFQIAGAHCPSDFGMGDVSLDCTYVNSEEGSGVSAVDLSIVVRVFFPPALRKAPETDFLVAVIEECLDNKDSILCAPLKPMFDCFRRVAGFMTFPPVPKSRGNITVNENGEPIIYGNYFSDKDGVDLHSAVVGLTHTIRMLGTGHLDGVIQKRGPLSCPAHMLNQVLEMILVASRPLTGLPITDETLPSLAAFLEAITQRGSRDNHRVVGTPQEVQDLLFARYLHRKRDAVMGMRALSEDELGVGREEAAEWLGERSSVARWLRQRLQEAKEPPHPAAAEGVRLQKAACESDPHGDVCVKGQLEAARQFAVVPPLPRDATDVRQLEEFVKGHGTGIWHWVGSASMGTVVDSEFRVKGIDSLSICDASVLPQVTRMNVQACILMLGRYAGVLHKRRNKQD